MNPKLPLRGLAWLFALLLFACDDQPAASSDAQATDSQALDTSLSLDQGVDPDEGVAKDADRPDSAMDAQEPDAEAPDVQVLDAEPADTALDASADAEPADAEALPDAALPPEAQSVLRVHALDIWGQPLPSAGTHIQWVNGATIRELTVPVAELALTEPGIYTFRVSHPYHEDAWLTVTFDGQPRAEGLTLSQRPDRHGALLAHRLRVIDQQRAQGHELYVGLRHRYFSAQARPARRGNRVELLMDGETAWRRIHDLATDAREELLYSTWWWVSTFEMIRLDLGQSEAVRRPNTILSVFERAAARKRVLVGEFWGSHDVFDFVTQDDALRAHAEDPFDNFEFMGQGNPSEGKFWLELAPFTFGERLRSQDPSTAALVFDEDPLIPSRVPPRWVDMTVDLPLVDPAAFQHASYHQKFVVADHEVAVVGGMNCTGHDWDTSEHRVFDPRRMDFEATAEERSEVRSHEAQPDYVPVKDYMTWLEGPSAQDVAEVFSLRWEHQRAQNARFSENTTPMEVVRDIEPRPENIQVQVTTTLPEPFYENGILETWLNAVSEAEHFIYVEDQYWRAPVLSEAIIARMEEVPDLKLIVLTQPINDWMDPACEWTSLNDQLLRQRFSGRYRTYQLKSFDTAPSLGFDETDGVFVGLYLHAKMLIVDDIFMSIGSCNKNNRGLFYEGEMNLAIVDPTWVRATRRRMLAALLPADFPPTDDPDVMFEQFEAAATWNDGVRVAWEEEDDDLDLDGDPVPPNYQPEGFVYSLSFVEPDDCVIEGLGPDVMKSH